MNENAMKQFIKCVRDELGGNIAPFWLEHSMDHENGGFIAETSNDLIVNPSASKGLILNARLLWAFSAMSDFTHKQRCLELAHGVYQTLQNNFWDSRYGGGYWTLDQQGKPVNRQKKTYGQGFLIYSLSEYYLRTQKLEALNQAKELFHLLEARAFDPENRGYFEVFEEDWTLSEQQQLSDKDLDAPKSMNTHLHLLEAYTHLYSIWKSPLLAKQLSSLINLFQDKILDPETSHFRLFFDASWNSQVARTSFGHDIEASWLLSRAAEVLGDSQLQAEVDLLAVQVAQAVYEKGLDAGSGLNYEYDGDSGEINFEKHFWCQAEAVVGFLNAFQLSRKQHFIEAAWKTWRFIEDHQVDKEYGGWFWKLDMNGRPDKSMPKISEWKCPYHNGRACIEVIQRLNALVHETTQKRRNILVYEQERKISGNRSVTGQISSVDK